MAEIRNISLAPMSDLRSTVRRLRTLDSAVELPAGLNELPALADQSSIRIKWAQHLGACKPIMITGQLAMITH